MNILEYQMIEVLKRLKDSYGVFEIKAEFEAEGSRMEEMMRLKDVTSAVGLPIILKIGGCEAVTDIYNALSIGVKGIIAPMIETPFALSKYINIIRTMVAEDNSNDIEFAFNVETITAVKNLTDILNVSDIGVISGITVGRVDLSGSMLIPKSQINSSLELFNTCFHVLAKARQHDIKTGLGGGIAKETLPLVEQYSQAGVLDKFETRKVVFPVEAYRHGEQAILEAIRFELLWLQSKRRYYSRIKVEDEKRIEMLEARLK